jgi:hypothetical protein
MPHRETPSSAKPIADDPGSLTRPLPGMTNAAGSANSQGKGSAFRKTLGIDHSVKLPLCQDSRQVAGIIPALKHRGICLFQAPPRQKPETIYRRRTVKKRRPTIF